MRNRNIRRLAAAGATAALAVTFNAAAAGAATADTGVGRQFTAPLTDLPPRVADPLDGDTGVVRQFTSPVTDPQPGVDAPLDGATAQLIMIEHAGSTTFVLIVTGV